MKTKKLSKVLLAAAALAFTVVVTPASVVEAAGPQNAAAQADAVQLDYNEIASWVDGGFIGNDASGSPMVMAIDAANQNAVIIFGDNSDMTAVSFVGPIIYAGQYAAITDVSNGATLLFTISAVNETTLAFDMGDIGTATVTAATKEDVLNTIKIAIENYVHIA